MRLRRRFLPLLSLSAIVAVLGCRDDAMSPSDPEDATRAVLASATAAPLVFRMVHAGDTHTCGVTTSDLAYCWGHNFVGVLGTGAGTVGDQLQPAPVAGGLRFRQVSVGPEHSCGVTTTDRAYCWGFNGYGKLGIGTSGTNTGGPIPVAGGLRFRFIRAGVNHTCGITRENVAYCWGDNRNGQLGDFSHTQRLTPKRVGKPYLWRWVSPGERHTCGVSTENVAYCWGSNTSGQMGVSGITTRSYPYPVEGGRLYRSIDAGHNHTCAVAMDYRAYCWGDGFTGQLGDGTRTSRSTPKPVAGGRFYQQVSAAYFHSCGLTRDGKELCWGSNPRGELGDGTRTDRLTPTPLAAALTLTQISAGESPGCGVTTEGKAYCWGENRYGQVGDGTKTQRLAPVPVAGPM